MDHKTKTKSDLLNELESIKGLLDNDDIPVLQEIIEGRTQISEEKIATALAKSFEPDELAALTSAYESLLQETLAERSETGTGAETSTENAYAEENYPLDLGELPVSSPVSGQHTPGPEDQQNEQALHLQQQPKQHVLPGQHALFDEAINSATNTAPVRALGENPFLPKHIRERLKGNRPEYPEDFSTTVFKAAQYPTSSRQRLIEELVGELLPDIELSLRQKLTQMTEHQLAALKNDPDTF